jgi:RsiW-degrading membrane proteinase PrsW (M82 family)
MNETTSEKKDLAWLRALYDIRVKECHHYNTMIWAFPVAYTALLASEIHNIKLGEWPLVIVALFNICLWYVFWCHLRNRSHIKEVLIFTEGKIAEEYGKSFVPDFPKKDPRTFPPKATTVINWSVGAVTGLFLLRAIFGILFGGAESCEAN